MPSVRFLVTFSGRAGDILWSLPTARQIAKAVGEPVDFRVMAPYASLVPLLAVQSCFASAAAVPEWTPVHSSWGDQPWQAPERVEEGYERSWHLGYRSDPQVALIDTIAQQQGIALEDPIPFLQADGAGPVAAGRYVSSGIGNPQDYPFMQFLRRLLPEDVAIVPSVAYPWLEAARLIRGSVAFVGGRSNNYVMAHGLGRPVITYEQDLLRRQARFANPYRDELLLPHAPRGVGDLAAAEGQAEIAARAIRALL